MPVCASGDVYSLLDPDLQANRGVEVKEIHRNNTDITPELTTTTCTPGEKIGTASKEDGKSDLGGADMQQALTNERHGTEELQEDILEGTCLGW